MNEIPYKDAMALEPNVETFEDHASAEFSTALAFDGGQVEQVLRGQTLKPRNERGEDRHWVLDNRTADVPLALDNASWGVAARVVWDVAFGGQALAGFGPVQLVPGRMRLGTGILTLLSMNRSA